MKFIRVNMSSLEVRTEEAPDAYASSGGRGLIAALLNDEVPATCDPLGPENKLIFAVGILTGTTMINTSRISIGAKSPLSGGAKESNAGGTVGAAVAIAIPTYVLAAALMAAVGATVKSSQEGQSMGAVFFMLHFLPPWLSAYAIITSPQSLLPTALTLAPFTALLTVALRNVFMTVPVWQIALSVAVQTVCAVAAIWLAGQALRLGTLRYGQRFKWRELLKARSR